MSFLLAWMGALCSIARVVILLSVSMKRWLRVVACFSKSSKAMPTAHASPMLLVPEPRAAQSSTSCLCSWCVVGSWRSAPAPHGERRLVELPLLAPSVYAM